jgi:hypothetical protein
MSSTEDYFAPFDYLQPRPDLEAFTQQRQEQRDSSRAERERQATQAHEQRSRGFFHLPTWASPETDTPIGEDEYGNTRYLAATGQEYILPRMQTQQRGSLIRGAYEAIPPMEDWRLPTREELGSAASAVGGAVQNFLEIPTNPNATFADILDVAGMAMTGGLAGTAPRGALRSGASRSEPERIPMYRQRETTPETASTPSNRPTDPYDEPVNWEAHGLTPPSDEWRNITYRQWDSARESDELPNEVLARFGLRNTDEDYNFSIDILDNESLMSETFGRAILEGVNDPDFIISGPGIRNDSNVLAAFRSPILEVIDSLQVPERGVRGADFLRTLERHPSVRNTEVRSLGLDIDPQRRYTAQELREAVEPSLWQVTAERAGRQYSTYQRQPITDSEIDYEEIIVRGSRGEGLPTYQARGGSHFTGDTMAHARVSVRQPDPDGIAGPDNRPYILVEELQSDLVQHGFFKPTPSKTIEEIFDRLYTDQGYRLQTFSLEREDFLPYLSRIASPDNFNYRELRKIAQEIVEELPNRVNTSAPTLIRWSDIDVTPTHQNFNNIPTHEWHSAGVDLEWDSLFARYNIPYTVENYDFARNVQTHPRLYGEIITDDNMFYPNFRAPSSAQDRDIATEDVTYLLSAVAREFADQRNTTTPPITNNREFTRTLVEGVLAYAQRNGVNEIVFPPFERIVAQRFTPGTDRYERAIQPGSGFHRTYVTALNDVIRELQEEFGPNMVQVGRRELPYHDSGYVHGSRRPERTERQYENDLAELAYWQALAEYNYNGNIREAMLDAGPGGPNLVEHFDRYYNSGWEQVGNLENLMQLNTGSISREFSPTEGISLNIGNLNDYDLSRPRFNKGGLVTASQKAFGELL